MALVLGAAGINQEGVTPLGKDVTPGCF